MNTTPQIPSTINFERIKVVGSVFSARDFLFDSLAGENSPADADVRIDRIDELIQLIDDERLRLNAPFLRVGLVQCLGELRDVSSSWYQLDGDQLPCNEALLLASDPNWVSERTRSSVLSVLADLPPSGVLSDHLRAGVRRHCLRALSMQLCNEDSADIFTVSFKRRFPIDVWEKAIESNDVRGIAVALRGIEAMYGADATLNWAAEKLSQLNEEDRDTFLFDVQLIVADSFRRDNWTGAIDRRTPETEYERQLLEAATQGLAQAEEEDDE